MVYSATPPGWDKPKCDCFMQSTSPSVYHDRSCPLFKPSPICDNCSHPEHLHTSSWNDRSEGSPCRVSGCFCREFYDKHGNPYANG